MKHLIAASTVALSLASSPAMSQLDQLGAGASTGTLEFTDLVTITTTLDGHSDGAPDVPSASSFFTDPSGNTATAGVQMDTSTLKIPELTGGSVSSGINQAAASASLGVQGYTFRPGGVGPAEQISVLLSFSGQISPSPDFETVDLDPANPGTLTLDVGTELRTFAYVYDAKAGNFGFFTVDNDPYSALALLESLQNSTSLDSVELSTNPAIGGLTIDLTNIDPVSGLADVIGSATLEVTLEPDDEIYLVAGLATQAINGQSALSLSTLTFDFDAPGGSLVVAGVVPIPPVGALMLSGLLFAGFLKKIHPSFPQLTGNGIGGLREQPF